MGKLIKKKLRGNILEPLIALVLIMVSLTACFAIVLKVKNNYNVAQINRANMAAGDILNKTILQADYISDEIVRDGLKIDKEVQWYDNEKKLLQITIIVSDQKQRILSSRSKIVLVHAETD